MTPLLQGRLARDAHASLAAVSARILRRPWTPNRSEVSLAGGLAGLALVHEALARAFPDADHLDRAQQALDRTMKRIERVPLGPGLYDGLAGIGWVMERLAPGDRDEDPCSVVDTALVRYVERHPRNAPFDLVRGLAGIGVYALARLRRPAGKRLLGAIVGRLSEMSVRGAPGVAWRTERNAVFDLGVAHGAAGVVALLGRITEADVDARLKRRAHALLENAVEWLLAQELPRTSGGCFAAAVGDGIPRTPARLAWCYGDAGIAATLLVAARAARQTAWERAAVRIGLRAAARPAVSSGIQDAGLCHGAAGVAHIFHRLHRTTGEKRFADASRRWFARTLAMRTPGRGFAGFSAWAPDAKGTMSWRADAGFLMGAGGITLALLAATGDNEPAWNRVLLLP